MGFYRIWAAALSVFSKGSRGMNRKRLLIVAGIVGTLLAGLVLSHTSIRFGNKEEEEIATVKAIEQFHGRLSMGRFDEIYDNANDVFQKSQSRDRLIEAMQDTQGHFGRFQQVEFSKLNVIIGAPVQIRAVYNSRFEKGDATELFLFVKQGDEVKLAQYEIYTGAVRPDAS